MSDAGTSQTYPHREMRRRAEVFGDVTLSVQASEWHYCSPRQGDASTPLELYDSVEIGLWRNESHEWITKPTELGIDGFDDLWHGDDVAGWVPISRLMELRQELRRRNSRHGA